MVASAIDNLSATGTRKEPCAPSQKENGKVRAGQRITEGKGNAEDADDSGEDDDLVNYDEVDDCVSHSFPLDMIGEGFRNRALSRLAANKPA